MNIRRLVLEARCRLVAKHAKTGFRHIDTEHITCASRDYVNTRRFN